MNKNIPEIYQLLQEISWHFGNHGFDGECCEDLSLIEFMALKMAYDNNDFSIQEIGNALKLTKSGASRIIDRLENKGYVNRKRSPVDGRVCCIPVDVKGAELLTRMLEKNTGDLDTKLKDLEPEMINQIKDTLQVLVETIQQK